MGVTTGAAFVEVWHKNGETFDITCSAIPLGAGGDGPGMVVGRSYLYEFKAEDIADAIAATGTTVAYNHFCFRVHSTGTVVRIGGNLLAGESRFRPCQSVARGQAATVSSAYTT